jgi:beta-glucosidase-like glycosyl hydrolase
MMNKEKARQKENIPTPPIIRFKTFLVDDVGLEYVIAFILVVILTPFVIKVLIPYFSPQRRIREPSGASAECSSLGISVERVSSPILYRDEGISPTPVGMYAGYTITNNSPSEYEDLWVKAEQFTGPHIGPAVSEDGIRKLDHLPSLEPVSVYFYFVSAQHTAAAENHFISLYTADPADGGSPLCSAMFTLTAEETIKANANKINSVTYGPPNPELGGTFLMTITGETGIIGAENVFAFTPASYAEWPADTFELTHVSITLSGGNTGTYEDTLFLNELTDTHTDYTLTYSFDVREPTDDSTSISPQSYISSGMRTKHTDTKNDTYAALPPIREAQNVTIIRSKTADDETLEGGGATRFTLLIVNNGSAEIALDTVVDLLPTLPAPASYIPTSSTFNGSLIDEPVISGNKITWTGPFPVFPEEPSILSYRAFFPSTVGSYENSAVGYIGESQIDTTADENDNAPAATSLLVTTEGVTPEDPDMTPEDTDLIPDTPDADDGDTGGESPEGDTPEEQDGTSQDDQDGTADQTQEDPSEEETATDTIQAGDTIASIDDPQGTDSEKGTDAATKDMLLDDDPLFREEDLTPVTPPPPPIPEETLYANRIVKELTLEQKVGQLLVISIPSSPTKEILESTIAEIKPGGIILFQPDMQNEAQTQELTAMLQEIAQEQGLPPLFIGVDEEGGTVERITFDPVTHDPAELGDLDDEAATKETTTHTAEVLNRLNLNVNFAPVADIAYSPDSLMAQRSFGSSPEQVSDHVTWSIDEYESSGILSTAKHFPGHGRTSVDSHETLPVIDISKDEWLASDALPFISAVDADVPFIMPGHLFFPQIDEHPSSISSVWLKDILRDELGYTGIIIADDIKMGALGEDIPRSAVEALTAGNDMIITVLDPELLQTTTQMILAYYRDPAHEDELNEKLMRILETKFPFADTSDMEDD